MESAAESRAFKPRQTLVAQAFLEGVDRLTALAVDRGYHAANLNITLEAWERRACELRAGNAAESLFTLTECEEICAGLRERLEQLAIDIRTDIAALANRVA